MIQSLTPNKINPQCLNHLSQYAKETRLLIIEMLTSAQCSHLASAFSIVEILTVLYHQIINVKHIKSQNVDRDYVILSKGHAVSALYATLMTAGCMSKELALSYNKKGSKLGGQPTKGSFPGIEASTGSLGHGLSMGVGCALALKNDHKSNHVYVIVGDGECQEGAIWEALMVASRYHLNNLTIIVDYNKLQAIDKTDDIMTGNLSTMFNAFGCSTIEIDGHDYCQIIDAVNQREKSQKPLVILAHTIKGKGLSFTENKVEWHYRSLNPELYVQAKKELEQ